MTIVSGGMNKIFEKFNNTYNTHILYVHTYKSFSKYLNTFVKYCTLSNVCKYLRAKKMVVDCN